MASPRVVEVDARAGHPPRVETQWTLPAQAGRTLVPLALHRDVRAAAGAGRMNVDQAYIFCRKIAHKHGANFSVGFRFLPRTKRRAVYAAYAFCRWADDIADEPSVIPSREDGKGPRAAWMARDPSPSSRPGMTQVEQLATWQAELDACYGG